MDRSGEIVLDRWQLIQPLAAGTFGIVYLARPVEGGEEVVVKVARLQEFPAHADVLHGRFDTEFAALERLRHDSLVRVLGYGRTDDGAPCLVMELVEGPSLAEWLDGRLPLEPDAVRWMFRQLFEAIAAVHAADVIHRDITPRNIIVQPGRRRLVLLDLGIARLGDQTMGTVGPIGTPRYIAPEQIRGEPQAASDIFSAGAILWRAITGQSHLAPGRELTSGGLLARQLMAGGPPDASRLPDDMPRTLARHVCSLLHPDPSQRPTATEALAEWDRRIDAWTATRAPVAAAAPRTTRGHWMPNVLPEEPFALQAELLSSLREGVDEDELARRLDRFTSEIPRLVKRLDDAIHDGSPSEASIAARSLAVAAADAGAPRLARLCDLLVGVADEGLLAPLSGMSASIQAEFTTVLLHLSALRAPVG